MDKVDIILNVVLIALIGLFLIPDWVCVQEFVEFETFGKTEETIRVPINNETHCYNVLEYIFIQKGKYKERALWRAVQLKRVANPFEALKMVQNGTFGESIISSSMSSSLSNTSSSLNWSFS